MKTTITTFLFVLIGITINAQFLFSEIDSSTCLVDNTTQIYSYVNWEIYQTENDQWDGNHLSDHCITLMEQPSLPPILNSFGIDLTSIDLEHSLFVRYKMEDLSEPFYYDQDKIFTLNAFVRDANLFTLNLDNSCPNGFCSGITTILGLEDGGNTGTRRNDFNFTDLNDCVISGCLPTEHTEINKINEIIYKITLDPLSSLADPLILSDVYIDPIWNDIGRIDEDVFISENFSTGSSYDINLRNLSQMSWIDSWLVINNNDGIPSASNMKYINFSPEINSPIPQTIRLEIDEYNNLFYQSHVQLRGGLIENSTSERHNLEIVSSSLDMCLLIIELIFEEGTSFYYQGGNLQFPNPTACLQFRDNGKLIIGKGQHLAYGNAGNGMLNLRSGGTVQFEENAEMLFNGTLVFYSYDEYEGKKEVSIHLPKSSHLIFGEYAQIVSINPDMKLKIYMEGGTLDVNNLSLEDQDKLEIIYPEDDVMTNAVFPFPNPTNETINIYNQFDIQINQYHLFDLNGKKVFDNTNSSLSNGLDISSLQSGAYMLLLDTELGVIRNKIMVIK